MPHRCYELDRTFTLARRWPRRALEASVGGLRVALVAVAADEVRLRVRDERTDASRELALGPAHGAVALDDHTVEVAAVRRRSWRAVDVDVVVRERPCPDEAFAALATPSWTSNRCSPRDQAAPVAGIRIRAPRRVTVEAHVHRGLAGESCGHAKVVLAGAWQLAGLELEQLSALGHGHVERAFTVHVRREPDGAEATASLSAFSYILNEAVRPPREHDPHLPPLRDFDLGGYFNVDIGALVAPDATSRGTFVVTVEGGRHRSNEVRIVVEPPAR